MLSPASSPTEMLLHIQGHVLNVLATFPGGIPPDSTISNAVNLLWNAIDGLPTHRDVLRQATVVQDAIDVFIGAKPDETERAYADAVSAFFLFRKKEHALCPVNVH